jgi:alpha,alpha-trehalase
MSTTNQSDKVAAYISDNWERSVHYPGEIRPKTASLPFPYTAPCISGSFTYFFYWDTYFTNLGLLQQDRIDLAQNNCDNMIYLIKQKGFVPNSTHEGDDTRSQPPYFCMMVRDVYEKTGDKTWLKSAVAAVETEYRFWMTRRSTPTTLNRHYHQASARYLLDFYAWALVARLGMDPDLPEASRLDIASCYLAEAETGWDFNPRFSGRCPDYNPVDLNSNLYLYEKNLAWFALELGRGDSSVWESAAERRRELVDQHLWNYRDGLFFDFNYAHGTQSEIPSLAAFHPLWVGLASAKQAGQVRANLPLFEYDFGISVCSKARRAKSFQWDYPNAWPPLFWTTICGLDRYGFHDDCRRLANKFRALVIDNFERTGQLWEKFDVTSGKVGAGEYHAQPMLGWTAGVFLALAKYV